MPLDDPSSILPLFDGDSSSHNKTLWERIFGPGRFTRMILLTLLITAEQLSSYPTRENKSLILLLC